MTFKSDVALRMKKWISQVFSVGLFVEYVGAVRIIGLQLVFISDLEA